MKPVGWILILVIGAALSFIGGFTIRQPSLVIEQVAELRTAADALDQAALAANAILAMSASSFVLCRAKPEQSQKEPDAKQ
jgi:hypothetical protein